MLDHPGTYLGVLTAGRTACAVAAGAQAGRGLGAQGQAATGLPATEPSERHCRGGGRSVHESVKKVSY